MKYDELKMVDLHLTSEDVEAIFRTGMIISTIQNHLGEKDDLMSVTTGECVCGDELPRVSGILTALLDNPYWKVVEGRE